MIGDTGPGLGCEAMPRDAAVGILRQDGLDALLAQQTALARFGELALNSESLDEILGEACRMVASALGTDLAKVLELQPDGRTLLVRAGCGWHPGVVGEVRIETDASSSEGHALRTGRPVISVVAEERRFTLPEFLHDNGVRALINVVIPGRANRSPYGVLEVDSRTERTFGDGDIAFLQTYANLIAAAVDRLRVLTEVKRSAAFARGVLAASPDCVMVLDTDGTLRFISEGGLASKELAGSSDAVGRTLVSLWPEAERAKIEDAIGRAACGETVRIDGMRPDRSGAPRWWEVGFATLPAVGDEPVRLVVTSRDVTARREAETARRESDERLRAVFEAAPIGILVAEAPSGRIVAGNPRSEAVFGHPVLPTPDVESHKNWVSFHADGRRVQSEEYPLIRALRGEEQPQLEVHYQFDDGRRGWVSLNAAPVRGANGAITGAIVMAQDIDLQKRAAVTLERSRTTLEARVEATTRDLAQSERTLVAEIGGRQAAESMVRQLQKMEAVGQLTGGIAHDFNNMLSVVISGLTLTRRRLARGRTDVEAFIDAALDGAMRAGALTQRLLAFSRQQALSPQPVDLNRLLAGMADLLHRTLGEAMQVETVLAADPWLLHADPGQLENAVLNLAVNARDAMPAGGRLTIETANMRLDEAYVREHAEVAAGQYVMVAVTDTGTGIAPEVLGQVFDPFFTTKEVGRGTGLGLSQVYGFVKQSGGHVMIYSEPGHGTSVKIYLPRYYGTVTGETRRAAHPSPPPPSSSTRDPAAGSRGQIVVLVVEDEARVRELTVAAVRELGYTAIPAENAAAALRELDAHPDVALLFTDVVMPDMNGRALADEAVRRRPGLRVLFTTGYARDAVVHNGVLDPDVQLLGKPFDLDQLAAKLNDVLEGREV